MKDSAQIQCPTCGYEESFSFGQTLNDFLCIVCSSSIDSKTLYQKIKKQLSPEKRGKGIANRKRIPSEFTDFLIEKHPCFSDKKTLGAFDGFDWAWILVSSSEARQWCNFSLLNENDWKLLLQNSVDPDFFQRLHDLLNLRNVKAVLESGEEFFQYCPWERLSDEIIKDLLITHPEWSEKCDMTKLSPAQWCDILMQIPDLASHFDLSKLSGQLTGLLLQKQPSLADKCNLEKMSPPDWVDLLCVQPQFRTQCKFSAFDGATWEYLLIQRPEFSDVCNFELLSGSDWLGLLAEQPQFVTFCSWSKILTALKKLLNTPQKILQNSEYFFETVAIHTDFHYVTKKDARTKLFASESDFWFLTSRMNWGKHIDWSLFSDGDLIPIFFNYPAFIADYPFTEKNIHKFQWFSLREIDWQKFDPFLTKCELVQHIRWALQGKNISTVLKSHPELEKYCFWGKLDSAEWRKLFMEFPENPKYFGQCDFRKIAENDWKMILSVPHAAVLQDICDLLRGNRVHEILEKNQWIDKYCNWNAISGENWIKLLAVFPRYAARCPWDKVLAYIKSLSADKQKSVKLSTPAFLDARKEIVWHGQSEIQKLPYEDFFTLMDFMDCERFVDNRSMDLPTFFTLIKHHPEFESHYDWKNRSLSERLWLAMTSQDVFLRHYAWESVSADKIKRVWPEGIPADYLSLFARNPGVAKRIGWTTFSSEEKVFMANQQPDVFIKCYGWKNFSEAEVSQILKNNITLIRKCPVLTNNILRDLNKTGYISETEMMTYWKVSWLDFFRHELPLDWISNLWIGCSFVLAFVFAGCMMTKGPCGLSAYSHDGKNIFFPIFMYVLWCASWTGICSTAIAAKTKWISLLCGFVFSLPGIFMFKSTYCATKFSRSNAICLLLTAIWFAVCLFRSSIRKKQIKLNSFEDAWKLLGLTAIPMLLLCFIICPPWTINQTRNLVRQFDSSFRPFPSARNYFWQELEKSDSVLFICREEFFRNITDRNAESAEKNLLKIKDAYSDFTFVAGLEKLYEKLVHELTQEELARQRAASQKAIEAFNRQDFSTAWEQSALAEPGNPKVQYIRGYCLYNGTGGAGRDFGKAIQYLRTAAENDHANAQYLLASMYAQGHGTKEDYSQAAYWFQKAADHNIPEAKCQLGLYYYLGQGVPQDYKKALPLLLFAAERADSRAYLCLASIYYQGLGTGKNEAEALKWFLKTAEGSGSGAVLAWCTLGKMYYAGQGTERNFTEAAKWFKKAAERQNAEAQYNYAIMLTRGEGVPRNYDEAEAWLNKAKANGHKKTWDALWEIKKLREKEAEAKRQQELYREYKEKAMKHFWAGDAREAYYDAISADKNDPEIMFVLSHCYTTGEGTFRDLDKALELAQKSADAGCVYGYFQMGIIYDRKRNYPMAFQNYLKAAEKGGDWFSNAFYNVGCCYMNGDGCRKDAVKAVYWWKKAAAKNHPDAEQNLGYTYFIGEKGVPRNRRTSLYWYKRAASHGSESAKSALREHRNEFR